MAAIFKNVVVAAVSENVVVAPKYEIPSWHEIIAPHPRLVHVFLVRVLRVHLATVTCNLSLRLQSRGSSHHVMTRILIRLQRIYNFLLFHAGLLSILDVF